MQKVWLDIFVSASKALLSSADTNTKITAVCISGNGPSLIVKCENEKYFSYLWNEKATLTKAEDGFLEQDILKNAKHSIFLPRLIDLKYNYPEIFASATKIFSGPEFLLHAITKNKAEITLLPETRFQNAYWNNDMLLECGIKKDLLPPFCKLFEEIGNLSDEMLFELSLPAKAKIPVFCGGPDFVAALIGTNTLFPNRICDRSGSSEGINLCCENPSVKEVSDVADLVTPKLTISPTVLVQSLETNSAPSPMQADLAAMSTMPTPQESTPQSISPTASLKTKIRVMPSVIPNLWNKSVIIPESGSLAEKSSEWKNLSSKILDAYKTILEQANRNEIDKIACCGGQTLNTEWMKYKTSLLKENFGISLYKSNCSESELIGDAAIALAALNKENDIRKVTERIVK